MKEADRHLLATQYGAGAQAQVHRSQITVYDGAAIGQVELLLTKAEDIVRQAGSRSSCGTQIVMVPNAVCQ